jgi:branched-chain amino acid transport system ATP-binding protein
MVGAMVRNFRRVDAERAAVEAIERTGLGDSSDRPPSELSTIDGKRLELARALATDPTLLLLDEISNGLRNDELEPLRSLIDSIRSQGVTLLVIEHNVRFLAAVCEWTIAMDGGCKLTEGTPQEVLRDPRVVETYLGRRRAA